MTLKKRLNIKRGNIDTLLLVMLYLFPILSYYGYEYTGFNLKLFWRLYFMVVPLIFVYVGNLWFNKNAYKKIPYFTLISFITLSTAFSIIMAYLYWGQSLVLGYGATACFLAIVFYFFLLKARPSLKSLELFVWVFASIYILLWLFGISRAPAIMFGNPENLLDDSRGIFRLHIPGRATLVIAFFLALNKYTILRKNSYIFLSIGFFVFIIFQVTRQIIFWSFLVGLYYILRNNKYVWGYLAVVAFISIVIFNSIRIPEDSVVGNLISLTENQVDAQKGGDDNIRIQEYRFFFSDLSKNFITDVFGNGMPHVNSVYGRYYFNTVQNSYRYFLSDVGYAQMYVVTGWVGLILYLFLFWKIFHRNVSPQVMFAKLFIVYQIGANIAASWYTHDVITIAVCVYILSMDGIRRNYVKSLRNEIYHRDTGV
jgi:hypothetical protein